MVIIDRADAGKTNTEVMLDLIYEATGVRLPEDKITHGLPKVLDQRPEIDDDPNTFIGVEIAAEYCWILAVGTTGFMYRRRHIGDLIDVPLEIYYYKIPIKLSEIVETLINPFLEYPLKPDDYIDYTITDSNTPTITINANPKSLLWIDGKTLDVLSTPPVLVPLIVNTELSGFTPQLREFNIADTLDGFVPEPLRAFEISDTLSGFDWTQTPLNILIANKLDGFDYTPGDLRINTVLNGFDFTPGSLRINDVLNGFDLTPGNLTINDVLNGFDPEAAVITGGDGIALDSNLISLNGSTFTLRTQALG